jgi:hypothetical protein
VHDDPEQAPLNPEKLYPEAGVAVSVTLVPLLKFAVHVPGQLIPAGLLVTVPLPETETLSWPGGCEAKLADID